MIRQSERFDRYEDAIASLSSAGLVYECYCTRREILEAAAAPHGPVGAYPETCRDLSEDERGDPPCLSPAGAAPAGRRRAGDLRRRSVPGRSAAPLTMSCCVATTAYRRTTSPSWSTTPPRASTSSSAATTSSPRRRGRSTCSTCSACRAAQYVHVPLVARCRWPAARQAPRRGDARRPVRRGRRGGPCRPCPAASLDSGGGNGAARFDLAQVAAAGRAPVRLGRPATILGVTRRRAAADDLERMLGYRGAIDERTGVTELGPDLLVVPFWTPGVLRRRRACRRSGRLRRRPRRSGPRPRGLAGARSARTCTSSSRTTSAGGSGRSCRRCGRSSTTTACATPSSSATPWASRSRSAQHHDVAQVSASVKLDDDYDGCRAALPPPGCRQRDRRRSARCWPGRHS